MPTLNPFCQFQVRGHVVDSSGVSRQIVNSFTYRLGAGTDLPTDRSVLAQQFKDHCWVNAAPLLHESYVPDGIFVLYPHLAGDTALFGVLQQAGAATGGRLPLHLCVNVILLTGLRSRSAYGVHRMAPVPLSYVNQDEINDAGYYPWEVFGNSLTAALNDPATPAAWVLLPVVWSRKLSGGAGHAAPGIGWSLSGRRVNRTIGVWRHRSERQLPPGVLHESCVLCSTVPERWGVHVEGLTGDSAALNGDWTLQHNGTCSWTTRAVGEDEDVPGWEMTTPSNVVWQLRGSYVTDLFRVATYRGSGVVPWSCLGPNTMTLQSSFNLADVPATLTVFKAP